MKYEIGDTVVIKWMDVKRVGQISEIRFRKKENRYYYDVTGEDGREYSKLPASPIGNKPECILVKETNLFLKSKKVS